MNDTAKGVERTVEGYEHTDRFLNTSRNDGGTCFNIKDNDSGLHTTDNMDTGKSYSHYDD